MENGAGGPGPVMEEGPEAFGDREYELADRYMGDDMVYQVGRGLGHALGVSYGHLGGRSGPSPERWIPPATETRLYGRSGTCPSSRRPSVGCQLACVYGIETLVTPPKSKSRTPSTPPSPTTSWVADQ